MRTRIPRKPNPTQRHIQKKVSWGRSVALEALDGIGCKVDIAAVDVEDAIEVLVADMLAGTLKILALLRSCFPWKRKLTRRCAFTYLTISTENI